MTESTKVQVNYKVRFRSSRTAAHDPKLTVVCGISIRVSSHEKGNWNDSAPGGA